MIDWKVYYGDGSTISSNDSEAEDIPSRNVICIVNKHEDVGRQIVTRHDYFWFDGFWTGGDIFGLFDYLLCPGWRKVLFGRTIKTDQYDQIVKRALKDPDFPVKSANLPGENL